MTAVRVAAVVLGGWAVLSAAIAGLLAAVVHRREWCSEALPTTDGDYHLTEVEQRQALAEADALIAELRDDHPGATPR